MRDASASERPLRVVYLDHVAQLSGGEIALLRLLPHLDRIDRHVILAEDGPLVSRLQDENISVEVLLMSPRARNLRKDRVRPGGVPFRALIDTAVYTVRLAFRLRRLRPDIVHTNSLKAGVYGSVAARLARIPIVWHVRDRIAPDYLPHAAIWLIRQMTRRLASEIVVNSLATLKTLHPYTDAVVVYSVLPEVVDAGRAHAARSVDSDDLIFGMIGRIAPWKGQHVFLEAFARAFPAGGTQRAAIVGESMFGEDDYAAELRSIVQRLDIADRVEFRGFREDVWEELSGFSVVVHASVTDEPFGQVVLEAQAAGKPVVASAGGGPAELIEDNVTGRLFPPGDIHALAAILSELADDPDARKRLGAAGSEAAERFGPERVTETIYGIYERVAGPTRA